MPDCSNTASAPVPGIQLNPEQRAAVQAWRRALVVVAGAGTGKTRVITERIRSCSNPSRSSRRNEILGLTFTDKAAWEMKHRVIAAAREGGETAVEPPSGHTQHVSRVLLCVPAEVNPELKPIDKSTTGFSCVAPAVATTRTIPAARPSRDNFSRLRGIFSRCQDELVTPDTISVMPATRLRISGASVARMAEDERSIRDVEIAKLQEIAGRIAPASPDPRPNS